MLNNKKKLLKSFDNPNKKKNPQTSFSTVLTPKHGAIVSGSGNFTHTMDKLINLICRSTEVHWSMLCFMWNLWKSRLSKGPRQEGKQGTNLGSQRTIASIALTFSPWHTCQLRISLLCAYLFPTSTTEGSQIYFSHAQSQVLPSLPHMCNLSFLEGSICTDKVNLPLIAL